MRKSFIAFLIPLSISTSLLVIITESYSPRNVPLLMILNLVSNSLVIAFSAYYSLKLSDISTLDYAITALLAALFSTELFWGMALPAPLFLIPGISFISVSLTSYLPKSIIYGTLIGFSSKPFISTLFFTIWGMVSEILFFNPAWIPYYPMWGALLDLYIILSDNEYSKYWVFFLGFLFGFSGWSLTKIYMIIFWGNWHPLFLSLMASFLNGLITGLGLMTGFKIGFKARSLSL